MKQGLQHCTKTSQFNTPKKANQSHLWETSTIGSEMHCGSSGRAAGVCDRDAGDCSLAAGSIDVSSVSSFSSQSYSVCPFEMSRLEHQNSVSRGYIDEQLTISSGYPIPKENECLEGINNKIAPPFETKQSQRANSPLGTLALESEAR
jgi:hypothetical protein